jgi:hypothetical protein
LIYLRGSLSLKTYNLMRAEFPIGRMDPYSIIINTNTAGGTDSQDYFTVEYNLISSMLSTDEKYVDSSSFTALSYYDSAYMSYEDSTNCNTATSSSYDSARCEGYRMVTGSLQNGDQSVTLIQITTIIDPDSEEITAWIDSTRKLLKSMDSETTLGSSTNHIESYLFGGYTTNLDLQRLLYSMVPYMIAATIIMVVVMVGFGFGGVVIAIRLAVTVGISLCWTYGMMAVVYQPGLGQRGFAKLTPSILMSSGVYWIIPIMSFSILTGLALDYDIFLMSRIVELRKQGWSDTASVTLAIEKTGPIITTAGVIMAISFAGLLLPKSTVLNQYGFSLFFGVMVDTFFVRSVLVPCIFSFFGDYNWWPRVMPPVILSETAEHVAMLAGYDDPVSYQKSLEDNAVRAQPCVSNDGNDGNDGGVGGCNNICPDSDGNAAGRIVDEVDESKSNKNNQGYGLAVNDDPNEGDIELAVGSVNPSSKSNHQSATAAAVAELQLTEVQL